MTQSGAVCRTGVRVGASVGCGVKIDIGLVTVAGVGPAVVCGVIPGFGSGPVAGTVPGTFPGTAPGVAGRPTEGRGLEGDLTGEGFGGAQSSGHIMARGSM